MMNKKGSGTTMSTWAELITILVVAGACITVAFSTMNVWTSYTGNETNLQILNILNQTSLSDYSLGGKGAVEQGTITQSSWGFNWSKAWNLISAMFTIVWDLVTGRFLYYLLLMAGLGTMLSLQIAIAVQALLIIMILFAIVRMVTKVKA